MSYDYKWTCYYSRKNFRKDYLWLYLEHVCADFSAHLCPPDFYKNMYLHFVFLHFYHMANNDDLWNIAEPPNGLHVHHIQLARIQFISNGIHDSKKVIYLMETSIAPSIRRILPERFGPYTSIDLKNITFKGFYKPMAG